MQRNISILIGILGLSYVTILLLAPQHIADYTISDIDYWRETEHRLLLKTKYDYNDKNNILSFPKIIGEWKSFDFRYPNYVYSKLNADILMSRGYTNDDKDIIWMDIINSRTGESFHKQRICVKASGWSIDNESIAEFKILEPSSYYTKFYTNRLDISKKDKKQVMVYWFMFKKFGDKDAVTMIRLSSPTKNNDTDATFDLIKTFVEKQLFDTMYEEMEEDRTISDYLLEKFKESF